MWCSRILWKCIAIGLWDGSKVKERLYSQGESRQSKRWQWRQHASEKPWSSCPFWVQQRHVDRTAVAGCPTEAISSASVLLEAVWVRAFYASCLEHVEPPKPLGGFLQTRTSRFQSQQYRCIWAMIWNQIICSKSSVRACCVTTLYSSFLVCEM